MAKGVFVQGFSFLTSSPISLAMVAEVLEKRGLPVRRPEGMGTRWMPPGLVIPYLPELNGYFVVDSLAEPWPDPMGHPDTDQETFSAWCMGAFGPLAYPGGLARAAQHSYSWPPGREVPQSHQGFLRLRLSYVIGADEEAPVLPAGRAASAELLVMSGVAHVLLSEVPGMLAYFNPNGEVLRGPEEFSRLFLECQAQKKLPLPLWCNVRYFQMAEGLSLMDTVGNGQLDLDDLEAIFPPEYAPEQVDYYLRNVTHALPDLAGRLADGDGIDGPDEHDGGWVVRVEQESLCEPPRRVFRLYPKRCEAQVKAALASL